MCVLVTYRTCGEGLFTSNMSDEETDVEAGEVSGEAQSDWVNTVQGLHQQPGVVDPDDIKFDFSHLSDDDLELLDEQTKRTLNRHAEIHESQHNQAKNTLRGVMIIIGALAAGSPLVFSFWQTIEFSESVHIIRSVIALILLIVIILMINEIVLDLLETVRSSFDILSPERTRSGRFTRLLIVFGLMNIEAAEEESGGGIRSVSKLNELGPVIDEPEKDLEHGILSNRLNRIKRNEDVINENMRNLYLNYQRAIYALQRASIVLALAATVLMLLGAQF